MTVTADVCDHRLFRRLAEQWILSFSRTYYEMENGLYTLDLTKAKEFTKGNLKYYRYLIESRYRVGDREFRNYENAVEHSMTMLILTHGFGGFRNV